MTSLKGKAVRIFFRSTEDALNPTSFLIDDVALTVN
jgi:hypothetical protein